MRELRKTLKGLERTLLVSALKSGKSWEQAKALLPDVDPALLDSNFKAWALRAAGLAPKAEALPEAAVPAPELAPEAPEVEAKPEKKKHKRG